jgi:glycosyltransferase involved in cell wall biosynthesis
MLYIILKIRVFPSPPATIGNLMHIVHVIDSLAASDGGTSRAVADLTSHLSDIEDCKVSIMTQTSSSPELECAENVEIHRISPTFQRGKVFQKLREIDQQCPIDLIHTNGIWSLFLHFSTAYARKTNTKYFATPHGMLEPWSMKQKRLKKTIAWWIYQKSDLKHADAIQVTAASETRSVTDLGLGKTIEIPNGVDVKPVSKEVPREQIALFLSRIHPKKGIPILLEAWDKLNVDDWQLKIVGPGEHRYLNELESKISKMDRGDQVSLLPAAGGDAKDKLLQTASVFVLPTHSENFGIVIAEALVMELPVITTTGTPWTNLNEVGCGWCIELNADNLTHALREGLTTSPKRLKEMGELGRQHIIENFTWPSIAGKLATFYKQTLSSI